MVISGLNIFKSN